MSEALLSFDQIRQGAHDLAGRRQDARRSYVKHATAAAEAECEYRKAKAICFTQARSDEKGVGESEILADGETADLRHKRDLNQALAKADLLRIEEIEREQSTLRQLADFSKEMETIG